MKKLILVIFVQGAQFQCRLFLFGPGIDIWRSCRFIGALMRSLCLLPGGLGRFVPCSVGANHCRLRHIGWDNCGHGLTSRPRESASGPFLDQHLQLFQYPPRSSGALLAGTLPHQYCSARFACRVLFWDFTSSWSCCCCRLLGWMFILLVTLFREGNEFD